MSADVPTPPFWIDPRDSDPEVRKERVKLLVGGLNAIGLALFIGAIIAPFLDSGRNGSILRTVLGALLGIACVLGAFVLLRYIKPKE